MKFPYLSISLIGFNSSYLEIITKLSIVPLFAGEITAKIKKKTLLVTSLVISNSFLLRFY